MSPTFHEWPREVRELPRDAIQVPHTCAQVQIPCKPCDLSHKQSQDVLQHSIGVKSRDSRQHWRFRRSARLSRQIRQKGDNCWHGLKSVATWHRSETRLPRPGMHRNLTSTCPMRLTPPALRYAKLSCVTVGLVSVAGGLWRHSHNVVLVFLVVTQP